MKNIGFEIKSFNQEDELGTFTAIANKKWLKDKVNDVTVDGCFRWDEERKPKMLYNHDTTKVIGKWLELKETNQGLWVKGQLALNTPLGNEVYQLLKMGALDSLSIGYRVNKESYDRVNNTNYLEDITIHEISVVVFECNEGSLVESVKSDSIEEVVETIEEANTVAIEEIQPVQEEASIEENIEVANADEEPSSKQSDEVAEALLESKLNNFLLSVKLNSFLKNQ